MSKLEPELDLSQHPYPEAKWSPQKGKDLLGTLEPFSSQTPAVRAQAHPVPEAVGTAAPLFRSGGS